MGRREGGPQGKGGPNGGGPEGEAPEGGEGPKGRGARMGQGAEGGGPDGGRPQIQSMRLNFRCMSPSGFSDTQMEQYKVK